jgi:hypothetical protein
MSKLSKSNFFSDPQNIIAVGVTVISLCALIVSIHQTMVLKEEKELMREHSRASVWPYLEFGSEKGHDLNDNSINHFTLSISNNGVGPAIITDVRVSYNDTIAQNWWKLFNIQGIPDSIDYSISNRSFNGLVMQPGKFFEILNFDINLPLANEFYKRLEGLSIEIYYESIYGEKWKFDKGTTTKLENFNGLPEEEQFW